MKEAPLTYKPHSLRWEKTIHNAPTTQFPTSSVTPTMIAPAAMFVLTLPSMISASVDVKLARQMDVILQVTSRSATRGTLRQVLAVAAEMILTVKAIKLAAPVGVLRISSLSAQLIIMQSALPHRAL